VKQIEETMFRIIDIKVGKKAHRKIEHFSASGHDAGSSSKSCKTMSLSAAIVRKDNPNEYNDTAIFTFLSLWRPNSLKN
jgi:hypothetical protein